MFKRETQARSAKTNSSAERNGILTYIGAAVDAKDPSKRRSVCVWGGGWGIQKVRHTRRMEHDSDDSHSAEILSGEVGQSNTAAIIKGAWSRRIEKNPNEKKWGALEGGEGERRCGGETSCSEWGKRELSRGL